jgi:uncharacterized protein YdeI (YjbR/CyaY-like superfamily)
MAEDLEVLLVADAAAWHDWLAENHAMPGGIWLVLAKKGTTSPTSISYDQALEQALRFGWIDGQVKRRDEATFQQRFTPRRARSKWSRNNVENVARLTDQGLMHPAGLAAVEAAKADGRWEAAYAGPATMDVPADFTEALAASPDAAAMFDVLTSQNRYAIMFRLSGIKRADTRARRIVQYVEMLERGETLHPQRAQRRDPTT